MKHPPLVLLEWEDAKVIDNGAWAENVSHDYKPHIFLQVGFLLSSNEHGVVLTQAWHPELVAARDQIPLACIRSMTVLRKR